MIFDWTDTGTFMVPQEDAPRNYYGGGASLLSELSSWFSGNAKANHADEAFEKTGVPIEIGVFGSSTHFPTVLASAIDIGTDGTDDTDGIDDTDANLDWDSDTEDLALETGGPGPNFEEFYDAIENSTELRDEIDADSEMDYFDVDELTAALDMASNALFNATQKADSAKADYDHAARLLRQASEQNKPSAQRNEMEASSKLKEAQKVKARARYYKNLINNKLQEKTREASALSKRMKAIAASGAKKAKERKKTREINARNARNVQQKNQRLQQQQDMREAREAEKKAQTEAREAREAARKAAREAEKKAQTEAREAREAARKAAREAEKKAQREAREAAKEAANEKKRKSLEAMFNFVRSFVEAKKPPGTAQIIVVITNTKWYNFFYDKTGVTNTPTGPITAYFLFGNFSTYIQDVITADSKDQNRLTRTGLPVPSAFSAFQPDHGFYSKEDIARFSAPKNAQNVYAKTTRQRLQEWAGSDECSALTLTKELTGQVSEGLDVYVGS